MIIMACGTSSAIAYPVVKDEYKVEIINLIDPGSCAAVLATRSGKIGVIATVATVASFAFQNKILELKKEVGVHAVGCPLFVPLVEGGFIETPETVKVAKGYLKPLLEKEIDTLILGCTHYPHLGKVLQNICGTNVVLIDPASEAVEDAKKMLKKAGTLRNKGNAKYQYFVTSSPLQFEDLGSRLLSKSITGAKQIELS